MVGVFSGMGSGGNLYRGMRRNPETGTNSPSLPLLQDALVCAVKGSAMRFIHKFALSAALLGVAAEKKEGE